MKLAKRIIAVVAAPALLAGFMLAGSAAAKPAASAGPTLPYKITFTADVITGTTTFTLDSTSCTLSGNGGLDHPCFLGGAGTFGPPASGTFSVTGSAFGPISLTLTQETANCGDGAAVLQTSNGPVTEKAKVTLNNTVIETASDMFIVKGTLKIGPSVSRCPAETVVG